MNKPSAWDAPELSAPSRADDPRTKAAIEAAHQVFKAGRGWRVAIREALAAVDRHTEAAAEERPSTHPQGDGLLAVTS